MNAEAIVRAWLGAADALLALEHAAYRTLFRTADIAERFRIGVQVEAATEAYERHLRCQDAVLDLIEEPELSGHFVERVRRRVVLCETLAAELRGHAAP